MDGRVDIIIPAYNEEDKIRETVESLKSIEGIRSIIVVDDKSTDDTVKIARELEVDLIELDRNQGKGNAIKAGLEHSKGDIVALLDADLGSTSRWVEELISPVVKDEADFTIARFGKARKKGGFGLVKKLARWGVEHFAGESIDTTLSGQRVYKREVIDSMAYIPDDFGIEIAMTVYALRSGYRLKEVEVDMTHSETGRDFRGFMHRGKQFKDILKTIAVLHFKLRG